MLRNGGAAVRHHAAVARGDTDAVTRPLSWSPLMTLGVELLSGFLEGIAIEDAEVAALRPRDDGETSDSKSAERLLTYLRSLRAMMAVGVPPLPGTRVQRVTVDDVPAVWLTPNARSWNSSRAPRRVLLWFHGGAFVLCNTATHARLMSSMGVAGDAHRRHEPRVRGGVAQHERAAVEPQQHASRRPRRVPRTRVRREPHRGDVVDGDALHARSRQRRHADRHHRAQASKVRQEPLRALRVARLAVVSRS